MTTQLRNIGALIAVLRASANVPVTAGGAGDDTLVTGVILDRAEKGFPQTGVLAIPFTTTLGATETLSLAYTVQSGNAANLSDAQTLVSATAEVIATGPAGGGTVSGVIEIDLPLRAAGRYVRANFTPNLSRANTDTAELSSVMVFGGADRLPQ